MLHCLVEWSKDESIVVSSVAHRPIYLFKYELQGIQGDFEISLKLIRRVRGPPVPRSKVPTNNSLNPYKLPQLNESSEFCTKKLGICNELGLAMEQLFGTSTEYASSTCSSISYL